MPRESTVAWLRLHDHVEGARQFGVSVELFTWRVNYTGVARQLAGARRHQRGARRA